MREQKDRGVKGAKRVYYRKDGATERTEKLERPYVHRALLPKRKQTVHYQLRIPDNTLSR